jgi:predicted 3-demethylubiquinone-9 3-methyltransferase (glyoxalase superfamily)
MKSMQKIRPFLWLDGQAEQAARFYASIFKNSKIESVSPMSATFRLDGMEFVALNGGPQFKFTVQHFNARASKVRSKVKRMDDHTGPVTKSRSARGLAGLRLEAL